MYIRENKKVCSREKQEATRKSSVSAFFNAHNRPEISAPIRSYSRTKGLHKTHLGEAHLREKSLLSSSHLQPPPIRFVTDQTIREF